jgi:hypothetical protein
LLQEAGVEVAGGLWPESKLVIGLSRDHR